jgi:hypothetical protein
LSPVRGRAELDEHVFGAALEGRRDIARRHLVEAWANAASFGQAPREMDASIDHLYPTLRESRGVREATIGLSQARMVAAVRERGARPLRTDELSRWAQRSRERSGTWSERSR